MAWFQIFPDGPEYEARRRKGTFIPPDISLKQLRDAVPKHLTERPTSKSLYYILQHIAITVGVYWLGLHIDSTLHKFFITHPERKLLADLFLRPVLWLSYWSCQGFVFAGHWCLGKYTLPLNISSRS